MNHPRLPLWIIAGIKANNKLAIIPAVVPLKFLTSAKIIMVVSEPNDNNPKIKVNE